MKTDANLEDILHGHTHTQSPGIAVCAHMHGNIPLHFALTETQQSFWIQTDAQHGGDKDHSKGK